MAAGADAAARSEMTPGGRRVPTAPSRRHLPDLGSVETITMAPTLAQISGWRWWSRYLVVRCAEPSVRHIPQHPSWPRDRSLHR
jgi:hypothetical protein